MFAGPRFRLHARSLTRHEVKSVQARPVIPPMLPANAKWHPSLPIPHTAALYHGGLHILMMSGGSARSASSIDWLKSTYGGGAGMHHAA